MIAKKQKFGYGLLALVIGLGYPMLNELIALGVFQVLSILFKENVRTLTMLPYYIELGSDILVGALCIGLFWRLFHQSDLKINRNGSLSTWIQCIGIGCGVLGLSTLWIGLAHHIPALSESLYLFEKFNRMNAYGGLLSSIGLAVIVTPVIEEVVYRGLVLRCLEKIKPGLFAIVGSALLFGILHGMLLQSVYAFFMGVIAGAVYAKTRRLMYPIVIHMTNNLLSSLSVMAPSLSLVLNGLVIVMILPMGYLLYRLWKQEPYSENVLS